MTGRGRAAKGEIAPQSAREGAGSKIRAVFLPRTMGLFVLLIIILGFGAGALRKEFALTLSAAAFLIVWLYCLVMTLLTARIRRTQAGRLAVRIPKREIYTGERTDIVFSGKGSGSIIPGILVRFRLLLHTADGRHIQQNLDPTEEHGSCTAGKRGAYFSEYDEYTIFDILGFFCFAYRIPCETGHRLLVCPHPAPEPPAIDVSGGGTEHRSEFHIKRSDNLIEHRPYVPGDDPRRINWKLFGHGNELFVREGENEPPPHSKICFLIDSHYDSMLYTAETGGQGVDLLCEYALSGALELLNAGMEIYVAYTGAPAAASLPDSDSNPNHGNNFIQGATPAGLTAAFALPAAIRWPVSAEDPDAAEMPALPADCGIAIFALPRENAGGSALNRFLDGIVSDNSRRGIGLFFLYNDTVSDDAARLCADFYRCRPGLRVRLIKAGD